ncbi:hypothetical protein Pmani_006711 [Petrolisthes manimaculis]|uniref:Uncharacterized protein n=1 Tax=Petrolisthes manimaculis TaxID=1843537 RepID=A0AAE1Q985_9EUCA|nr:hypothetical protein Pmani_006711 [Petrolisthes manimaculis]
MSLATVRTTNSATIQTANSTRQPPHIPSSTDPHSNENAATGDKENDANLVRAVDKIMEKLETNDMEIGLMNEEIKTSGLRYKLRSFSNGRSLDPHSHFDLRSLDINGPEEAAVPDLSSCWIPLLDITQHHPLQTPLPSCRSS